MIHVKESMLDENTVSVYVSGVLDERTVPILKKVCDRHLDRHRRVLVNLEAVAHITRDGRGFLREISDKVSISHVPEFMKPDHRV
ncbi:MAG: hypothetical protein HY912_22430 [Desulfomonile tiedjei]|uniref:STAS domain-containing protein n=1 Tax=Desulfomonile tiedjei TaxID=2358 RepID=A0A9D6V542_9BACT|nr:hypothetical protein [Desulfomonile tiedjei]